MKVEYDLVKQQLFIGPWKHEEAPLIYQYLEHPNWAPWLEASAQTLANRANVFPHGQLVIKNSLGEYLASVSMNKITWDGKVVHLPSWDVVAGDPTDYSNTYDVMGNALILMSMNVAPESKGMQLPSKLIAYTKDVAKGLGIEYLLGSFRPSGFGKAKKLMGHDLAFGLYCSMKQEDGVKPLDPWLRSLWWNGLEMLSVDPQAMTVPVTLEQFEEYKATYKSEVWEEIAPGIWECEEVGKWTVDKNSGIATYVESNVWGSLSLST